MADQNVPKSAAKKLSVDEIEEAIIRYRGVIAAVAQHFQVTRPTIYDRIAKNKRLQKALDDARETTTDYVESKLLTFVDKDHYRAVEFYLLTIGRKRGYWKTPPRAIHDVDLEDIAAELARRIDPKKVHDKQEILALLMEIVDVQIESENGKGGPPMPPPIEIVFKDASASQEIRDQYLSDLKPSE